MTQVSLGCVPPGSSRGESIFLPFPVSKGHLCPLAGGPISPAMWSPSHAICSLAFSPTTLSHF